MSDPVPAPGPMVVLGEYVAPVVVTGAALEVALLEVLEVLELLDGSPPDWFPQAASSTKAAAPKALIAIPADHLRTPEGSWLVP